MKNNKVVENPTKIDMSKFFGVEFEKTKVDALMLKEKLNFSIEDKGIWVHTNQGKIPIEFDSKRFRLAEVPILLSDTEKIEKLGFKIEYKLKDIIKNQLNYFLEKDNR